MTSVDIVEVVFLVVVFGIGVMGFMKAAFSDDEKK